MKSLLVAINSKYIHPAMGLHQIYANSRYNVTLKEFTIKDDIKEIINYINMMILRFFYLVVISGISILLKKYFLV